MRNSENNISQNFLNKNLVICTNFFRPDFIGIASRTTDLACELDVLGYNVSVFTAMPYYPAWQIRPTYRHKIFLKETLDGINIYRNWLYVPNNTNGITSFKRIIHELSFVLLQFVNCMIHFNTIVKANYIIIFSPFFLQGFNGFIFSQLLRKKVIFHVEDIQPDSAIDLGMLDNHRLWRSLIPSLHFLERTFYKYSYRVSTLTNGMRKNIQKKLSSSKKKLLLLPLWLDTRKFKADQTLRKQFREKESISEETFVVGYSGNLGKKQNLDHLIRIAATNELDSRVKFVIVGEGSTKNMLLKKQKQLRLKNIEFRPLLPLKSYIEFLNGIDLSYLSQDENVDRIFFPSKLLPILSCGSPVLCIARKDSELAKMIQNTGAGFIRSFSEFQETVELINFLTNNKYQLDEKRLQAKSFVMKEFDKSKVVAKFLQEIEIDNPR